MLNLKEADIMLTPPPFSPQDVQQETNNIHGRI